MTKSLQNQQNQLFASLDITQDFTDDNGLPVLGAVANSTDPGDMDRNYHAFTKALNSVTYSEIVIPAGRFHFRSQLKVTHKDSATLLPKKIIRGSTNSTTISLPNVRYQIDSTPPYQTKSPATILDFSQISDNTDSSPLLWIFGTSILLEQFLTKEIGRGDISYMLNHGRTVNNGDLLLLTDKNENSYGPREYYRKGEFLKVTSLQGQMITFDATHDDYQADTCEIHKLNPVQIELENILLVDTRPKVLDASKKIHGAAAGLRIDCAENSKINNVYVIDASYHSGILLNNVFNVDVTACKVLMALPDESRLIKNATGYSDWYSGDIYGINIADSQNVRVDNVDSSACKHAITTGSGGTGILGIVNRHLKITNSKFTSMPAPLYWQNNMATVAALRKIGPANFHGNTEDSLCQHNLLLGAGFNIGGHNNSFINNDIWTDNYNELIPSIPPSTPYYGVYHDTAFYFDETKSAEFKIINNRVYIRKFYQNPHIDNVDDGQLCFGEFIHFNYGGNFNRKELKPKPHSRGDCVYSYELAGKIYSEGTLEISGNRIVIHGIPKDDDQTHIFKSSLITVFGVTVDRQMDHYLTMHTEPNIQHIKNAMRAHMQVDVKITNNSFIVYSNPKLSRMVVAINPINSSDKKTTRVRNLEVSGNCFEGFFRLSINAANIFEDSSGQEMLSENLVVKDNEFLSSDIEDEAILLNTIPDPADATKKAFPKTKRNGSIIKNNIIRKA